MVEWNGLSILREFLCFFINFLKKCFWRTHTHILFLGPLIPMFWISGDVSSGFQSQSGFCLIHFCRGECNVHSSGTTPADFLTAGIIASHFLTCTNRGGNWLGFEWAITATEDKRPSIGPTVLGMVDYYIVILTNVHIVVIPIF